VLWTVTLASLLAIVVIASLAFIGTTTVEVEPRQHTVVFDETALFTAYPLASATNTPASRISYTIETLTREDSAKASASGTEQVETQSSGQITVYNEYSNEPVRLIKNTRFETPSGLIYRARDPIVIPGRTGAGSSIVPGSTVVTVYADKAGEQYNTGPVSRFTLPGLESSPDMFPAVYAISSGSMSGGFKGEKPRVAERDLEAAQAQIMSQLEARIQSDLAGGAIDGFVFSNLSQVEYVPLPAESNDDGSVLVRMRAVAKVPTFDEHAIAGYLASMTSASTDDVLLSISDTSTMSARLLASDDIVFGVDPIDFALSGNATFVWDTDAPQLASDLAGRDRDAFDAIVRNYPGVERASLRLRPFWARTLPEDPEDITVIVTQAE
jgi:hypothetical protein